ARTGLLAADHHGHRRRQRPGLRLRLAPGRRPAVAFRRNHGLPQRHPALARRAPDRAPAQQPQRSRALPGRTRHRRSIPARGCRTLGLSPPQRRNHAMSFAARRPSSTLLALATVLVVLAGLAACNRDTAADGDVPPAGAAERSQDPAAHRIEDDVRALADDRMQGRETGTTGHDFAAEYVAGRFAEAGLAPGGEDGSWF